MSKPTTILRVGLDLTVASLIPILGGHRIRDGLGQQTEIVEREGIRDDGSPAVRAKVDGHVYFISFVLEIL